MDTGLSVVYQPVPIVLYFLGNFGGHGLVWNKHALPAWRNSHSAISSSNRITIHTWCPFFVRALSHSVFILLLTKAAKTTCPYQEKAKAQQTMAKDCQMTTKQYGSVCNNIINYLIWLWPFLLMTSDVRSKSLNWPMVIKQKKHFGLRRWM